MTEGWKLAPDQAEVDRLAAVAYYGFHNDIGSMPIDFDLQSPVMRGNWRRAVRAMLAAAPEPPRVSVEEVERVRAALDATPDTEAYVPVHYDDLRSVLALIDMLPGTPGQPKPEVTT